MVAIALCVASAAPGKVETGFPAEAAKTKRWPVCPANAPAMPGENCVTDGDTIRMGLTRMRLVAIDAPERNEPGFEAARDALIAILETGPLEVADRGRDRFGRRLVALTVNGQDVGDAMIAAGHARPWP